MHLIKDSDGGAVLKCQSPMLTRGISTNSTPLEKVAGTRVSAHAAVDTSRSTFALHMQQHFACLGYLEGVTEVLFCTFICASWSLLWKRAS